MPDPCRSRVPAFPVDFALALRDLSGLDVFVETGTYRGETAAALAAHFRRLLSIEGCRERYEALQALPANVELHCGDSAEMLAEVLGPLAGAAIVFLDAHWIAAGSAPEQDGYQAGLPYCPLRGELGAIRDGDIVLIDDAHFFTHPPRRRGEDGQWLSLDQIIGLLPGRYVFIHEGILCAVPEWLRGPMREWLRANWRGLQRYVDNAHASGGNAAEFEIQDEAALR